ncbi:unnamed protein product [Periconia digitata]|uniref:Peptidase C15, pyroglutamyl peptidase I-like protein n=1 Tax=Periconia digitata TaxID=1303443 RepID=A0A9W4UP70_9PLEO|nr:unnamed protein product [Periconia digitata]
MAPVAAAVTRVLITGFGPFQNVPVNPSFAIVSRLPTTLPNNIEIYTHPSAIPVSYHPTIELLPELYGSTQPDIALHIGVAEGRKYFAVEAGSSRNNFDLIRDNDGRNFSDAEGVAAWGDSPTRLDTDLDLDGTIESWQERTKDFKWPAMLSREMQSMGDVAEQKVDVKVSRGLSVAMGNVEEEEISVMAPDPDDEVRWSDNVGFYLCGFIYYAGMVQKSRMTAAEGSANARVGKRDTVFMHVPLLISDEEIGVGVDVTTELVQSLVENWRALKE